MFHTFFSRTHRRLCILGVLFVALAIVALCGPLLCGCYAEIAGNIHDSVLLSQTYKFSTPITQQHTAWDSEHWLTGNKTSRFEDNLRSDLHYITSGSSGGFTNLFIGFINLLYLASVSDRIPILPPFFPSDHVGPTNPYIHFGDIFDLPSLQETLRMPIIEWHDVKYFSGGFNFHKTFPSPEILGCWASSPHVDKHIAYHSFSHDILNLNISYTKVHHENQNIHGHSLIFSLASLIHPNHERGELWAPHEMGDSELPNKHLACFDDLYYSTTNPWTEYEWFHQYSPQWRFVGKHVKFAQGMLDIANEYVQKTLGVKDDFPPFITVHIRHGDFGSSCARESGNHLDCFAPLSEWAKLVQEVQRELYEKKQLDVQRVILASDEEDPSFLDEVKKLGWDIINHNVMDTMGKFGNEWYAPIIDTIILSMGEGFVGTSHSTFSVVAQKRVEDWNGGVTREHSWDPSP